MLLLNSTYTVSVHQKYRLIMHHKRCFPNKNIKYCIKFLTWHDKIFHIKIYNSLYTLVQKCGPPINFLIVGEKFLIIFGFTYFDFVLTNIFLDCYTKTMMRILVLNEQKRK